MNLSFGTTLTPGVLIQRHSFDLAFDLGFNCVHTLASTPVMCLIAGSWNYFAQGEDLLFCSGGRFAVRSLFLQSQVVIGAQ